MMKTEMIKFKIVKGILLAGLLVSAMLYESSMFTEVLFSFQTTCFEYSIFSCTGDERLQFLTDVKQYAMEENITVFSAAREQSGNITRIRIFTDGDDVRKQIQKKSGIKEKSYTTPVYGMTDVTFLSFDELKHDQYRNVNFISYAGNAEDAEHLYSRISKKYSINAPSRTENNVKFLTGMVWVVTAAIFVFITFVEISGCQMSVAKELKTGVDVSVIIRRFILLETGIDFLEFLLVRGILSLMFSGQVLPHFGAGIYSAAVLVSCLLYSYYAFFKWEKLFTGEKKRTGVIKYVLVVAVFLFAINQFLTNRLNEQLVHDMKKTGGGWFEKETDRYKLIADRASLFSFRGQAVIEYYAIPASPC